jgi:hypothetical protein
MTSIFSWASQTGLIIGLVAPPLQHDDGGTLAPQP